MSTLIVVAILIIVIVAVLGAIKRGQQGSKKFDPVKARRVISINEQPTFKRLRDALPNHTVLAQVAFSALITSKGYANRNRYNRKVVDFVVLDQAYNVVAIVELDDSSHKGREHKDADRDALLLEAGYKVIRYPRTPDLDKVKADFAVLLNPVPAPAGIPTETTVTDPRLPTPVLPQAQTAP